MRVRTTINYNQLDVDLLNYSNYSYTVYIVVLDCCYERESIISTRKFEKRGCFTAAGGNSSEDREEVGRGWGRLENRSQRRQDGGGGGAEDGESNLSGRGMRC